MDFQQEQVFKPTEIELDWESDVDFCRVSPTFWAKIDYFKM